MVAVSISRVCAIWTFPGMIALCGPALMIARVTATVTTPHVSASLVSWARTVVFVHAPKIAPTAVSVLIGRASVTQGTRDSTARWWNVQKSATATDTAPTEPAIAGRDGPVKTVQSLLAPTTVTITASVQMVNATAVPDSQAKIVLFARALQAATATGPAQTTLVNVGMDGLDLIVHCNHAQQSALVMGIVTTGLVSVSLVSQGCTALCLLAPLRVPVMGTVLPRVLPWRVNVILAMKAMIALKCRVLTTVLDTENVSMEFVPVTTDGVVKTVLVAALELGNAVLEMVNVLMGRALATPVGLGTLVTFVRACTTVLNMDSVTMELASVKKGTEVVTVLSRPNPSLASVPSTAFGAVFSSAQKFTRRRVQDHHMNVTQNARRNVFHSVSLGRCQ